jgi:hypothetical protein
MIGLPEIRISLRNRNAACSRKGYCGRAGRKVEIKCEKTRRSGSFRRAPPSGVQSGGAVMPPGRYGSPRRLSSQRSSRLLMNELRCLPGLPLPPLAPGFDAAELRIVAK